MDSKFLFSMVETIGWLAILWIITILYSFLAFILQLLLLKGCSTDIIISLQHITQSIMFIFSMLTVWRTNWVYSHYLVVGLVLCIIFFKMHSYTVSNIEYHRIYMENMKKGIKGDKNDYPNNITLRNFITYLAMPTFIYKNSYPRSTTGFRPTYFITKFLICIFLIVSVK